jgi:hypothetical protein
MYELHKRLVLPDLTRALSWLPAVLAAVLVLLICLKAAMAVDLVWDSLAYHLPFSAQRVGLLSDWQLQRPPPQQDTLMGYYLGFPILGDLLRGWMWKLSGWPESVNLLGIFSLLVLFAYLKWAYPELEVAWVILGTLAIPAVQTAAAGNYVDLPANAAFAILLFSIVNLWATPHKFLHPAPWIILFLAAAAAANIKLQTSVFVCLSLPFVLWPAWRLLRDRKVSWRIIAGAAVLFACASLVIAFNLIKNLVLYKNPFFPIDMTIAGIHLVGTLTHDGWLIPGRVLGNLAQPLQWLLSVLEFRSLDGRPIPYTNGMGDVPMTSISSGMGGFFSGLVVASVCFFVIAVYRRRDRLSVVLFVTFLSSSLIIALFPNSQNLRYEAFWMVSLLTSCLLLLQHSDLRQYLQSYKIVLIASLAFVTSVTGGTYFKPVWNPLTTFVENVGAEKLLEKIVQSGDVICLEQGPGEWDNRFTILFSPLLHPKLAGEKPYAIKEGFCQGYKTLPRQGHMNPG